MTSLTLRDLTERRTATITVPQAGQVLGVGRDAAYVAAARGEIPTLRLGRRLVVPVPRLLELLGVPPSGDNEAGPATGPALATVVPLARENRESQHAPDTAP